MIYLFLAIVGLFSLQAFASWRQGIVLLILLAALQDPLRKLTPGTPGWMALATVPVLIAMIAGSMVTRRGWWARFGRTHPGIGKLILLLIVSCLPAIAISATYGPGSWMITLVGMMSYGIMTASLIVGFHLPRSREHIIHILKVYAGIHGVMMLGALMEKSGWFGSWQVLGSAALGYEWVRHVPGYLVEMIAGFYRSADVMGWHAASVTCFAMVLAHIHSGRRRWFWIAMATLAIAALLLCGRRKMVFMLPVFLGGLLLIQYSAGRAARASALLLLLAVPTAGVYFFSSWLGEDATQLRYYRETGGESLDQFETHTLDSVVTTIRQSGFFGEGLGFATPGSHHVRAARPRVWQESAPSRVVVELGVPGALVAVVLLFLIARRMFKIATNESRARTPDHLLAGALFAYLLANVGSLAVSGQILADPFVSAFLGLVGGMVLGLKQERFLRGGHLMSARETGPTMPGRFSSRIQLPSG